MDFLKEYEKVTENMLENFFKFEEDLDKISYEIDITRNAMEKFSSDIRKLDIDSFMESTKDLDCETGLSDEQKKNIKKEVFDIMREDSVSLRDYLSSRESYKSVIIENIIGGIDESVISKDGEYPYDEKLAKSRTKAINQSKYMLILIGIDNYVQRNENSIPENITKTIDGFIAMSDKIDIEIDSSNIKEAMKNEIKDIFIANEILSSSGFVIDKNNSREAMTEIFERLEISENVYGSISEKDKEEILKESIEWAEKNCPNNALIKESIISAEKFIYEEEIER